MKNRLILIVINDPDPNCTWCHGTGRYLSLGGETVTCLNCTHRHIVIHKAKILDKIFRILDDTLLADACCERVVKKISQKIYESIFSLRGTSDAK